MCVQFMIRQSLRDLSVRYEAKVFEEFEFKSHVFPRYSAPVIGWRDGERVLKPYRFGLIPHFEKNEKPKSVFHNARMETISEKPSFRSAFLKNRCVVPMDSFLETIWDSETEKWLARFFPKNRETLVAAAIFNQWQSPTGERIPTFSLITQPAPRFIADSGHDRSPIFMRPDSIDTWIQGGDRDSQALHRVLAEGQDQIEFDLERIS